MKNALIILAGGSGKRLSYLTNTPKQYIKIGSKNIIEYFLDNLDKNIFDIIVIVCESKLRKKYLFDLKNKFFKHNIYFTQSGFNRQDSSKKGVYFLNKFKPKIVLIHDAARPFVSQTIISKCLEVLKNCDGTAPIMNTSNSLIQFDNEKI